MADLEPTVKSSGNEKIFGDLPVDEHGKSKKIKLLSLRRPHMRAFHYAWFSLFLSFFGWFALAPLQSQILKQGVIDGFTNENFKIQNIVAVLGTIFMRFTIGPVCDRFGPRLAQSVLIGVFSIPVLFVAAARKYWQWVTARFFIGSIGATFVVTQFWTSAMFASNIVGTANGTCAGWGSLGGGITQVIMPLIRRLMERAVLKTSDLADTEAFDSSWRLAMIWPACSLLGFSILLYITSDDVPQGKFKDLHRAGTKEKINPFRAFFRAATNWRSWILFLLYSACFGIELIMNGNLSKYFQGALEAFEFGESTAGLMASLIGLQSLLTRTLGGLFSDVTARKFGMRGRLWTLFILELLEGVTFVIFSRMKVIGAAIPMFILFSIFVKLAQGATFGIVPFVDPAFSGAVSGIVAAGGNVGAVVGGLYVNPGVKGGMSKGFRNLGFTVIGFSFLVFLLWWPQYGSMLTKPTMVAKVTDGEETEQDSIPVKTGS